MLSGNTISRIVEAGGRIVVIGRFSYRYNAIDGTIQRAKTEDRGREWIDHEGRQCGSWEIMYKF